MFIGDRYEVISQVGSGGMSEVYKVKDHKLNRNVAVKVLKQEFSEDRNFVAKFRVEAQSAAGLSHPNIVSVYDVGEENGIYYIVMELIEGITLKRYIQKKGSLSVKEATSIAIQVAQGIECAHNNHIIHRDIKPQNIIISKEGKVKVTDFGIARAASANTINSNAMGSVHYISPEQARGGYIDERSDIYSLGITLFEMLTGKVPFEGDSTVSIALQHIQGEIPDIKSMVPDIPVSTEKIVYKCTQKKQDRRYMKISALIEDLKRSLVEPETDFVQIASPQPVNGATVMYDPKQVNAKATETEMADKKKKMPGESDQVAVINEPDDDDIDKVNPRLDHVIHLAGVVVAISFLIIVVMLAFYFFGQDNISATEDETQETLAEGYVYMPDLYGMTVTEIENTLREVNLGRKFEYAKDSSVSEGKCFKQSVEANSVVEKYQTITCTISEGANSFQAPDYAGQTMTAAQRAITELSLLYEVNYTFSDTVPIDTVISSSPLAPEEVVPGDTITLTVSRGKEYVADGTVPNITGVGINEAIVRLTSSGLLVGSYSYEENDNVAKDAVISQQFKAGDKLPVGTTVDVVVSTGPSEVEVPDLKYGHYTKEKAERVLNQAGLKLGKVTTEYSDRKVGRVIGQNPVAGTTVDAGSTVDIVISGGPEPETTTSAEEATTTTATDTKVYSGSFAVSKSVNLGGASAGTFAVTVDGVAIDVGAYADVANWPTDTFVYTIVKDAVGVSNVIATLDGVEVYNMSIQIN